MSREMKLTNLDCIHQIPLNWNLMDIKYVSSLINGDRSNQYPSGNDIKDSGVNFITSENLHNLKLEIVENSKYITAEKYNSLRGAKLRINDLIFCLRGSLGICSINTDLTEGTIASSLVVIRPNDKINPYYLNYSINSNLIKKQIDYWMNGSCAANLSAKDTREFKICVPPISEQNQIVNYLNSKCEAIDQAIQKQKDIVNKLIEYKQSVITQAVTKGLNPSVEMKNTPISGLTQIPKTWNIVPLKTLFSFSKGLSITKSDLTDEGIKVISYGQIHSKKCDGVHATNELIRFTAEKFKSNNSLAKCGSFIFADTSEDLEGCGNAIYITNEVYGGYHTVILNPKETHDYRYLAYLFKTDAWRTELRKQLTEVKVFSITQFALKNMHVILPSYEEMVQIADFLDSKCLKINKSIERSNKIIQKLEEYKKALIYNAVTGKIDCRNA